VEEPKLKCGKPLLMALLEQWLSWDASCQSVAIGNLCHRISATYVLAGNLFRSCHKPCLEEAL
jgi:hypothetical protein